MNKEQKFYNILQDLFIGATLEGDSGYVNLMNIKTNYFNKIKIKIEDEVKRKFGDNKPEDLYDKLYTFFDSYFSEGGSIFFSSTPSYKNIYAKVYSDREDVSLFWKTSKLYYVKSETNYRTIENLKLNNDPEIAFDFYFDASKLKNKQTNEKKELAFYFLGMQKQGGKKVIKFRVIYKNDNKYDKLKKILKLKENSKITKYILENSDNLDKKITFKNNGLDLKIIDEKGGKGFAKAELLIQEDQGLLLDIIVEPSISDPKNVEKYLYLKGVKLNAEHIEKAFKIYKKQTEIDYFIHKDAKGFLREQFDLYIYQHLAGNMETIFDKDNLLGLKKIKEIAYLAIDYIGNFEDELKKIWLKPKFARKSNYVITLDKLATKKNGLEIINDIVKNPGIIEQTKEWRELGIIKNDFDKKTIVSDKKLNKIFEKLPIDTKYFKNMEVDIISLFNNLDEELDGRLIKSDNFQAINTLLPKYKEQAQTIYIDPPYNTNEEGFPYVDNLQHSSWLSMMENRLDLASQLLNKSGLFFSSIANNAKYYYETSKLNLLIDSILPQRMGDLIWKRRSGSGSNTIKGITEMHEFIICYGKEQSELYKNILSQDDFQKYINKDEKGIFKWNNTVINQYTKQQRPNLYYSVFFDIKKDQVLFKNEINIKDKNLIEITPSRDGKSVFFCDENSMKEINKRGIIKAFKENSGYSIKIKKYLYKSDGTINGNILKSVIEKKDTTFDVGGTSQGTKELNNLFGKMVFKNPKPTNLISLLTHVSTNKNNNNLVVDFFAGSGTTAHSVMKLNKQDGGNRKYLIIEMGDYFNDVIVPRLKKVAYSDKWSLGVSGGGSGISTFFKYYELEQYEDALKKSTYNPTTEELENIDFSLSEKQAKDALDIDFKKEKARFVFEKLYPDVDIPETISNLIGKKIKKITRDKVIFEEDYELDLNNLDFEKYEPLKNLIYW